MLIWLGPTLGAMFAWGIAQGLVKKYVGEVPPARFCLYYAIANAIVNVGFWLWKHDPALPVFGDTHFATIGLLAYVLDGIAWIFYYQSIVYGPISIVGTLSAAYPALNVVFARALLGEALTTEQYIGVAMVILSCLGLAYEPPGSSSKETRKRWIPFAGIALLIWGINGVIIKYAYGVPEPRPGASEANLALFIAMGGMATLGVYGMIYGRRGAVSGMARSFLPMATMALGSLLAAIAYQSGKAALVTPISGAYPIVTVPFAAILLKERPPLLHWICIGAVLVGMVLTTYFAPA